MKVSAGFFPSPALLLTLFGVVSLVFSGCVRAPVFAPGEHINAASSQALCGSLNAAREGAVSFRALLDATVRGPGSDAASFRYAIVGKADDKLRIDVLPSEGAYTLALITVRGGDALFLNTQEKRALEGCSVEQALEKLLGFNGMTPAAVKGLVLGQTPALDCRSVTVYRSDNSRVIFLDPVAHIAWEVDADSSELQRAHFLSENGQAVLAIAERGERSGVRTVDFTIYKPVSATAQMQIRKLVPNPDIAESAFSVPVPPGYEREGC